MAALLDFLKNKESAEKSKKTARKPAKKAEKVSVVKKETLKVEKKAEAPAKSVPASKIRNAKFSYETVKNPHISEKASTLAEKDQYIFEISPRANKNEVKSAIEGIYKVNVLSVNVIRIPAKKRRLGKTQGWRKSYKKAIVKIKNGQKIEIL
jgi:large subunit ribosomal protein L23